MRIIFLSRNKIITLKTQIQFHYSAYISEKTILASLYNKKKSWYYLSLANTLYERMEHHTTNYNTKHAIQWASK